MKRLIPLLAVLCMPAFADPPYDVTVTFTPANDPAFGPPTSHRLYQGCATGQTKTLVGTATSGQTFTGLLPAAGTYSFCVHGVYTTPDGPQEGPRSNIANVVINDWDPPTGTPTNLNVTVSCDASCTVNITSSP